MDVHSCLVQLFAHGPHINEWVQFLWSPFHAAVALGTEAAHVFVSVTEILSCLFQDDPGGASGNTKKQNKLEHKHLPSHWLVDQFNPILNIERNYLH